MTPRVRVGKVGLDVLSKVELHRLILGAVYERKKKIILNINARLVELAHTSHKWLVQYMYDVDHVFCDGGGIQLGALLTGQVVPEKITYNVWLWQLAKLCEEKNLSLYLLGGDSAVLQAAISNLRRHAPGLLINGHHGYFTKSKGHTENEAVIAAINRFRPHILLICFGMPLQEDWLRQNGERIASYVFLTGGGALDYISGRVKTTPKIFSKLYLEWFYRLCQDPRRLWKRYLLGNVIFAKIMLGDIILRRLKTARP